MLNVGVRKWINRTGIVIAAILLVSFSHALGSLNEPQASAAPCGDNVVFLGAAGSGERGNGPANQGIVVSHAFTELSNALAAYKLYPRAQTVDYPASAVSVILYSPSTYFSGISEGVRNAITQLRQIQNGLRANPACGGQRIVLGGYSQGAMVMHRVVRELSPGGTEADPEILSRIAGVVLIADGDKLPDETNLNFLPSTRRAVGIGVKFRAGGSGSVTSGFDASIRDRIYNVCVNGDAVCDSGFVDLFPIPFRGGPLAAGVNIHTSAYRTSTLGAVRFLANRMARPLLGSQGPTAPSTTTPPSSTPSTDGPPAGDCEGQTLNKSYPVTCTIVRRNIAIREDYSNIRVLSRDVPPASEVVDSRPTGLGLAQLRAQGLEYRVITACPNGQARCDTLTGTPSGQPGVYPIESTYTLRTGSPQTVTWFLQIVAS